MVALFVPVKVHAVVVLFDGPKEVAARLIKNARSICIEEGIFAFAANKNRLTTLCTHPVNPGLCAVQRALMAIARFPAENDLTAIRRKGRRAVNPRLIGQHLAKAIGKAQLPKTTVLLIIPTHVNQVLAIGRKSRLKFEHVLLRSEANRLAIRQILLPKIPHGRKDQLLPVGRSYGMADDLDVKLRLKHLMLKTNRLHHLVLRPEVEGNGAHFPGLHIHLADFALRPNVNLAVVRRPGEARIDAEDRPGLLLVLAQIVVQRELLARTQLAYKKRALRAHATHKGEVLPIVGYLRAKSTAHASGYSPNLSGFQIVAADLVDLFVGVFVVLKIPARIHVLTEIDIAAIGRRAGLVDVLLVVLAFGELQAAAAGEVVHPYFARPQRALRSKVLAGNEIHAVGHPCGVVQQAEIFMGYLSGIAAIGIHHPDVVAPAGIAGEKDFAAIGTKARLHLPGQAAAKDFGLPACSRHEVDIAQQVKDQLAAVGTEIEIHPRPFIQRKGVHFKGARRVVYIPLVGLLLGPKSCNKTSQNKNHREKTGRYIHFLRILQPKVGKL